MILKSVLPQDQRGASMVEFALAIFVFILILGGVVDLARWILANRHSSALSFEGARFASVQPGLELASAQWAPGNVTCSINPCTNQFNAFQRVNALLTDADREGIDGRLPSMSSNRRQDPLDDIPDLFCFQVTLPFKPFLLHWDMFQQATSSTCIPYLLAN